MYNQYYWEQIIISLQNFISDIMIVFSVALFIIYALGTTVLVIEKWENRHNFRKIFGFEPPYSPSHINAYNIISMEEVLCSLPKEDQEEGLRIAKYYGYCRLLKSTIPTESVPV